MNEENKLSKTKRTIVSVWSIFLVVYSIIQAVVYFVISVAEINVAFSIGSLALKAVSLILVLIYRKDILKYDENKTTGILLFVSILVSILISFVVGR